jgi:murein DD-endopeptidase MepM/ murein hydrolase activator NlpD
MAFGFLASCAGPAEPAPRDIAAAPAIVDGPAPPVPAPEPEPPPPPPPPELTLACGGPAKQGGAILCKTLPAADLALDGKLVATADDGGVALIGLRRDAPATVEVSAHLKDRNETMSVSVEVLARKDTVSKFKMECKKIAPQSPEDKRHAEVSWVKKDRALKTFSAPLAPVALVKPADGPYSSAYGVTRTYVPTTKDCEGSTSVHNGQDIAIGTGTEIHAPMAGTVLLADPDLFYEGGAVFLDLGRGLLSVTMHMSQIDVQTGDTVAQGQLLGLSGATGRVTGPHLHWALKFRNVHSDDRGTDIWLDPIVLLDLKAPE